jgi:putative ABC transport system permease protein
LVELEVVAILQDRLGLPSILLPWTMAAAHSSAPMADIVYVAVDWGADVSAIEAAVGPAIVTGSDSYLTTLDAEFDRLSRLALLAIVGIAVVYSGVSIANTHAIASAGRADEFAALRLAGQHPARCGVSRAMRPCSASSSVPCSRSRSWQHP